MKKSTIDEAQALQKLMSDILRPFVPEFRRQVTKDSEGTCTLYIYSE